MWGLVLSLVNWVGLSPVPFVADKIGTTEPAIKLIISMFMGYPVAIVYHKYVKQHMELRNIFFVLTGFDMAFYNFGISMYHNLIPTLGIYLTTMILGPGKINVIVTFLFNVTYLMAGYILTESEDYDITWTMPQWVISLKLVALSFDMWDQEKLKAGEQLSATNKETAIETPPTLVELLGFVYFPSCFLVGPQFSFRRYSDFVYEKFPLEKYAGVCESESKNKLLVGIFYLAGFQLGVSVFSMKYMLSDEFWDRSVFYRHIYSGLWAHFALYKYISCWLITEASCIRFGISYNGEEATAGGAAAARWDGCSNIKLVRFELATKFQHYIDSFNYNTNHFAADYIYKRLNSLGNGNASPFFTLFFLALWHGTRSLGYYMTFFNVFIIIFMEKDLESILVKYEFYHKMWANNILRYVLYAMLKLYTIVIMGWSLAPFDLKVFDNWWSIYSSLYFSGFILFIPWEFVYKPLLIKGLKYFELKLKSE